MKKLRILLVLITGVICMQGCKLNVSLTGSDIDPRARTVYIKTFPNNSTLVNPILSQDFTNMLKDKVQGQTSLSIINASGGDYILEGEITSYSITPVAIGGDEIAAKNRLTITVNVRFTNKFDENKNFERSFSRYDDYLSSDNFSSIENTLVANINDKLTEDIFNAAFVNW